MNKFELKKKNEELLFEVEKLTKDYKHLQGEFNRLKKAYKMSEKQIKILTATIKNNNYDNSRCKCVKHTGT